jgi:hypothetical protein
VGEFFFGRYGSEKHKSGGFVPITISNRGAVVYRVHSFLVSPRFSSPLLLMVEHRGPVPEVWLLRRIKLASLLWGDADGFGVFFGKDVASVSYFCLLCLRSRICMVSDGGGGSFFPLSCVGVGFYCATVDGGSKIFPATSCSVTGGDGISFLLLSSHAGSRWSFNVYVASRRWFRAPDLVASTKFGASCEAWRRSWSWFELFQRTGVPAVSFGGGLCNSQVV